MSNLDQLRNSITRTMNSVVQGTYPPVDVYQTDNGVVIKTAPLDGLDPTSLEVSMQEKLLTIRGVTSDTETVSSDAYLRRERTFGEFEREIVIPIAVQAEKASAKVSKNVLTVHLPLIEQSPSEIINIQVAD